MEYTKRQRQYIAQLGAYNHNEKLSFFTLEDTRDKVHNRRCLTPEDCERVQYIEYGERLICLNGTPIEKDNTIAIDLETTQVDPWEGEIKIVGMSNGNRHWYWLGDNEYGDCQVLQQNHTVHTFLDEAQKRGYKFTAYNIQFEYKWLWLHYFAKVDFDHDPMVMAYVLGKPKLKLTVIAQEVLDRDPKTLEELAGRKLTPNRPLNWQADIVDREMLQETVAYCLEDCYETVIALDEFEQDINRQGFYELYCLDLEASKTAAKMSLRGVKASTSDLDELRDKITSYIEILRNDIIDWAGWYANPKSPKEMNKLLFETMNYDPDGLETRQDGYSVDAKSRQKLVEQDIGSDKPVISKYDQIAKLTDAYNKYVSKLSNWIKSDGRVHTNFHTCQTATGRLSSSDPNLQNIPNPEKYQSYGNDLIAEVGKKIRGCFVASPDSILIACDYASFELRILAYLSGEPTMIETFKQGYSLHDIMTEKLFGISLDRSIPEHESRRTVTKTINFGLVYGMEAVRLYEECKLRGIDWSLSYCQEVIDEYWRQLPYVSSWFDKVKRRAVDKGYSETMYGRRRYYQFSSQILYGGSPTPDDEEQLRQAGNHPIQGTNADVMREGMVKMDRIDDNVYLLLQVHDEFVFECPDESYADTIKYEMEHLVNLGDVPVIAEPVCAQNWGEAK